MSFQDVSIFYLLGKQTHLFYEILSNNQVAHQSVR